MSSKLSGGAQPRTVLAVPGSDRKKLSSAGSYDSDAIVFDLEDAVAANSRKQALSNVVGAVTDVDFGSKTLSCRTNAVQDAQQWREIVELGTIGRLNSILIPKVHSTREVHYVDVLLDQVEANFEDGRTRLDLLLESPKGLRDISDIARASPRIESLVFGRGDYALEVGVYDPVIGGTDARYPGDQWHWPASVVVNAARSEDLVPIDGPFVDFGDLAGCRDAAVRSRLLGFAGKWVIHPSQISVVNEVFSPTPEEIRWAEMVVREHSEATEAGRGAMAIDGIMIDAATYGMALRLLSRNRS